VTFLIFQALKEPYFCILQLVAFQINKMNSNTAHNFHIPVMGLGFTIDTPLKVARFGIDSVVSIIEDELVEEMRCHHSQTNGIDYTEIKSGSPDARARRITSYLNLLNFLVNEQFDEIRNEKLEEGTNLYRYFELLPESSTLKVLFLSMLKEKDPVMRRNQERQLRKNIRAGSIDVNIMAKADRLNYNSEGELLSREYSDALSALRGFALSDLNASVVLSAGYNPLLYTYIETFNDFFPDENGSLRKMIILKVSDYRSAITQGKILAKKGIWVSEFRIESGLNCGGHAFATEGKLMGPILEEFKNNREELNNELLKMCNQGLSAKGVTLLSEQTKLKITVQGGIGTSEENFFLLNYYNADATGWGSPFLLVPEATNVDEPTLEALATATKEDYYLSYSSPLGIPFHSFRRSSSEQQRLARIEKGRPGSPCYKKYLSTNTEFTEQPICTASREYQNLKLKEISKLNLSPEKLQKQSEKIMAKDCLCEGLGESVRLKNDIESSHKLTAVAICPGPNLAYFSGTYSLKEMVDHIYGRFKLPGLKKRSNMFVNELNLYVDYFKNELDDCPEKVNKLQSRHLQNFKSNLLEGIEYYRQLSASFQLETKTYIDNFLNELNIFRDQISVLLVPEVQEIEA